MQPTESSPKPCQMAGVGNTSMHCGERERLWDTYQKALSEFSACADALARAEDLSGIAELARLGDEANLRWRAARRKWEMHIEAHGCSRAWWSLLVS